MKRSIGVILVLALAAAACGSAGSIQPTTAPSSASSPSISVPPPEPILGAWRLEYTCEKILKAFQRAGIGELAAQGLVGMGVQSGPVGQLASSPDPCAGATTSERTVIFRPNGYLLRYQGEKQVDDCRCYQLLGGHTFVVPGEGGDPDITLQYRIKGTKLTFEAVMPDQCSSARCLSQFAYAVAQYAVSSWQRVNV